MKRAGLLAFVMAALVYMLALRDELKTALSRQSGWLYELLAILYPRLTAENYRFTPTFLLAKADQALLKAAIVVAALMLVGAYWRKIARIVVRQRVGERDFEMMVWLFYGLTMAHTADSYRLLVDLSKSKVFFVPFAFYSSFPDESVLLLVAVGVFFSGLMVIWGLWRQAAAVVFALLWIYQEGLFFGFGKANHQYAPMTYGLLLMPGYMYWPKPLMMFGLRVAVSLPYTMAGLEKWVAGAGYWLSGEATWGIWVSWLVLFWQTLFVLGVFSRFKIGFHLAGLVFHSAVFAYLGIGSWWHPWTAGYVFFYQWASLWNLIFVRGSLFLKN